MFAVVGALLATGLTTAAARLTSAARERNAVAAARAILHGRGRPEPGYVSLIVITRSGCSHCAALKAGPLPELLRQMSDRLRLEEQEARGDEPTPTLVVSGRRDYVIVGVQPTQILRQAVELANAPQGDAGIPRGVIALGR